MRKYNKINVWVVMLKKEVKDKQFRFVGFPTRQKARKFAKECFWLTTIIKGKLIIDF